MRIYDFKLTGITQSTLKTEILFSFASAKALGYDLLKLIYPQERISRTRIETVKRILKQAKKNGAVLMYVTPDQLNGESTEAEYIKNKFPDIPNECGEECIIIKL